jgi:uncharacterized membrane protein YhaH (DUF805 family)
MKKPEGKAPAGWYDAPEIPDVLQFWNGKHWSKNKSRKGDQSPELLPHPIKVSLIASVKHTLTNTLNYKGRASIREYWFFQVFYVILIGFSAIAVVDVGPLRFIPAIFIWGLLPTQLALYVRRCHDSNRRGWWYFIPIGNLIVLFDDSDTFENRFGEPSF